MTKKDYILIAANIADVLLWARGTGSTEAVVAVQETARRVAIGLRLDNPRFDRARFLAACGVDLT